MKTIMTLVASAFLASCAGTATTAGDVKPYPKNTCIVTDNKLGSMGTPITKVYGDQEVKFCCKPCIKKFNQNPGKYVRLLAKAKG